MRTFALLARHGVTDRSGHKKFYEVYPAGSLRKWRLTSRGYKKTTPDHKQARASILGGLREKMPCLVVPDAYATNGHGLDALIASLTVRAATQSRTLRATREQAPCGRREGGFTCRPTFRVCETLPWKVPNLTAITDLW